MEDQSLMSKFKVGDRVVITRTKWRQMLGAVGTVVKVRHIRRSSIPVAGASWTQRDVPPGDRVDFFVLDIPSEEPGKVVGYPHSHLELYRDDGNEKASWEDLPAWVPRRVKERA